MRYAVGLTRQAGRDLAGIVEHVARDDPSAAERLGTALIGAALSLERLPYRAPVMRRRPQVRKLLHGSYLVLFVVHEAARRVEVLRFWHAARGEPKW